MIGAAYVLLNNFRSEFKFLEKSSFASPIPVLIGSHREPSSVYPPGRVPQLRHAFASIEASKNRTVRRTVYVRFNTRSGPMR